MSAEREINCAEWLDLILSATSREMQIKAVETMVDDVRSKTRNRAERIVQQALLEIGRD